MNDPKLTTEEWRYISVLIAADVRQDQEAGLHSMSARHYEIWEKIQPACQWNKSFEEPED